MYTSTTNSKTVSILPNSEANAPIIHLNTFSAEGQKVYETTQVAGCRSRWWLSAIWTGTTIWCPGTVRPLSKTRTPAPAAGMSICGF